MLSRFIIYSICLMLISSTCSKKTEQVVELKHFPLNSLEEIITQTGVEFDDTISSDGNGSLRITATEPTTIKLFETGDIDVEDARLLYRARLKTEGVDGKVYLEMWVSLPGMGESFSKGLQSTLSGTNNWSTEEIPFFLKKGQNPDNIKLNLVIDGKGTVWIDDIYLLGASIQ